MTWEVRTFTLCDGWVNTWSITENGQAPRPETFATREDAEAALADFLAETAAAAAFGEIEEAEHEENYIIACIT